MFNPNFVIDVRTEIQQFELDYIKKSAGILEKKYGEQFLNAKPAKMLHRIPRSIANFGFNIIGNC